MNRRDFLKVGGAAMAGILSTQTSMAKSAVDYQSTGASILPGLPINDGYSFPAEWERHESTLMKFPSPQSWYPHQLSAARKEWAEVANTVAEFEPLIMAVRPQDKKTAKKLLSSQIELIEMPLNDAWSRDSGPMIVQNAYGDRRIAGFVFNGWGGKYPPFKDDALAKGRFARYLDMEMYVSDLVLEGGAVALDGERTLITTEECLMHTNRNPGWSRSQIESHLTNYLGVSKIIWIKNGLTPDPITDGHIDGMVAFAGPGTVLLHTTDEKDDPNNKITKAAKKVLENSVDAKGRKFEIIEIPLTSWDVVHMNFYICNGAIVVPTTGKKREDDVPLGILREVFPEREVVGVSGNILASGGGGVHCITQQVPAV